MYRKQIKEGDRIVLADGQDLKFNSLRHGIDRVLIAGKVEEDVFDDGSVRNTYYFLWEVGIEGGERLKFGRTPTYCFDRIPTWEEVLGPLAPDWPPMTLYQFRTLERDLELIRELIKTTFQERPAFLSLPG